MSLRERKKSLVSFSESQQRLVNFVNIIPLPIIFCGSNVLQKSPNRSICVSLHSYPLKGFEAI